MIICVLIYCPTDISEGDVENEKFYHTFDDLNGQAQTDSENVSGYFPQPSQHEPQHDEDYTTDYNNNEPEFVTNNPECSAVTEDNTNTAHVNSEDNNTPTPSATGDASHITEGSSLNDMIKGGSYQL